ncbi:hypothetical protein GLOIN_2v1791592 [Rhizophagus clarus]|uniref:F-box domain-containing protein n=1 Tax=Rhizophagus clarus TaxID=94130 RepID=A0A8H3QG29_9GLOM|nr:hypothetical protein GLOIN_2v1791592 [Rhizophagus clarus]
MTLPYLTDDCIYYILQHLQNDRSTLFNCLLVNRFWCKSTIPILYTNPFLNITEKNYTIILTIILCFNRTEILKLKDQLGINQIDNIDLDDEEYKPLFEYLKYLKNYNYFTINTVIRGWSIKYNLICRNKIYDIIPIFHQSILRQIRNIKQLDIFLHLFYYEGFQNFDVQNFTSNLTKLNSLSLNFHLKSTAHLTSDVEQEFLGNISNISLNLRKLIIKLPRTRRTNIQHTIYKNLTNNTTLRKLRTIIQKQNKLKIFKITNCYPLFNNILLYLVSQKHSLVNIEFSNTDFSNVDLKSFNYLYNLKYLVFENCKGIISEQCEVLNFVSFKLKKLSFKRSNWNDNVTNLMIKYLGASLQRLSVEDLKIPLMESILMYCPNLIYLKIRIDFHFDLSVLPFFKDLRIRILSISIYSYFTNNTTIEFFINLANNIPINIKKISLYSCSSNKFLQFKGFLENCHNCFEIINLGHFIDLKILRIVLNYIEKGENNLKFLGVQKFDKELNDEELELLNQIKDKGVKIVDFYNFCHFHNFV